MIFTIPEIWVVIVVVGVEAFYDYELALQDPETQGRQTKTAVLFREWGQNRGALFEWILYFSGKHKMREKWQFQRPYGTEENGRG